MRAGDVLFPKNDLPEGVQKVIFSEFGYASCGNNLHLIYNLQVRLYSKH